MKKSFAEFKRRLPVKLYLILAAILFFIFFSNDFGLVDIQKTAIILAVGVDKSEEGYTLTTQIAVPQSQQGQTVTSSVQIQAEAPTLCNCLSDIYAKTGWVPKLIFCDLIVVGEELAKEDIFGSLDYFLRDEYVSDSCLLAVCEGKAADLISSSSAIDNTTAFAIEKLFSDASEKTGHLSKNTLKEFSIGYYGASESGFMPYIRQIPLEKEMQKEQPTAAKSGEDGGAQEQMIYSASDTALFQKGKMVALLNSDQTFAFNLLRGKVFSGIFTVHEEEKPASLTVLKNEGGASLNMKGAPTAEFSLNLKVRIHNKGVPSPIGEIADSEPTEELLSLAKDKISEDVLSIWQTCVQANCDLFYFKRELYRSSLSKYNEWKEVLLTTVQPNIKVEVSKVS